MKDIRIQSIKLENFKCHRALEVHFQAGVTSIYGDNATGKSSIYDGLTWLLFGKDSRGSSDAEGIKPLGADGTAADHEAVTAVEAAFLVRDGEGEKTTELRRTMKEVWASKRGSSTLEYGGNISEYAVDGVPIKKNGFDGTVKELFGENLFRALTDVRYFPEGMKWQERRAVLFDMAGNLTDGQIMMQDPRFWDLKDMGTDLDTLKKKLTAERKKLAGAKNDGPARMSECQKLIDQFRGQDFETAKREATDLEERAKGLREELARLKAGKAGQEAAYALKAKQAEARALEAENRAYREQQRKIDRTEIAKRQLETAERDITYAYGRIEDTKGAIARLEQSLEDCRNEWIRVNGVAFSGGKCPTCGQVLPMERLKAQTAAFEEQKRKRLGELEGQAGHTKQMLESYRADLDRLLETQARAKAQRAEAEEALRGAPETEVRDMPEYRARKEALDKETADLEQRLRELETDEAGQRAALEQQLTDTTVQLKQAQQKAAEEGSLRYAQARLTQLRQEAQETAARLEEAEKALYLIEEFVRYKASFLESTVNAPFRLARFRLFREQANGGTEERCDVTVDGVPYASLNSAMQINAGIDIINALSGFYGVRVPLFIDNAESVTQLEAMDSQVIRLVVSENDKELRIV